MSGVVSAISVIGAIAGGIGAISSIDQASTMKKSAKDAQANADKQAKLMEQDMNRRNQKKPDIMGALNGNQTNAMAGQSGTLLTGPSGVDPGTLTLGKSTLLGG